jgi:aminoglycoside N3'-acetyltransferase
MLVQCSLNDMPTFDGKPGALLAMLDRLVGPTGTLLMPAYSTPEALGPDQVFDPAAAPTYTGITNEIFRRSPGVLRSLHPRHSICARGPLAGSLLAGHELCAYADGSGSPFDRLRAVEGACILTLGLPPAFVSFLHWVEDVEPDRFPMPIHGARPVGRRVRRADGQVIDILDHELRDGIAGRMALSRVAQRLSPQAMRIIPFKGVTLGVYRIGPLADELIALRDQGIVHYR